MLNFFNEKTYEKLNNAKFCGVEPFDHVIIDNFLSDDAANILLKEFPSVERFSWWKYDNFFEKKLAFNSRENLSQSYNDLFQFLNSAEILKHLEKLSGLDDLIPDHGLRGGGIHLIQSGGKLDVHEDFNIHPELQLMRRLNIIIYMNPVWDESWGGHLELWNNNMTRCIHKITPEFNRAVIFRTDQTSNHGHPTPLATPESVDRRSLALYYYTKVPTDTHVEPRSTVYKKLPWEGDELDELRKLRSKGRLEDKSSK